VVSPGIRKKDAGPEMSTSPPKLNVEGLWTREDSWSKQSVGTLIPFQIHEGIDGLPHIYRADLDDFRLFVEMGPNGWQAKVYDLKMHAWKYERHADTMEDGKDAIGFASFLVRRPVSARWTEY
jgi:hypothetical protein